MDDEEEIERLRKRFEECGVEADEDGFFVPKGVDGPPQLCKRCGVLAERPSEFAGSGDGVEVSGVQCVECFRLSQTDLRRWLDGFKS